MLADHIWLYSDGPDPDGSAKKNCRLDQSPCAAGGAQAKKIHGSEYFEARKIVLGDLDGDGIQDLAFNIRLRALEERTITSSSSPCFSIRMAGICTRRIARSAARATET
jgi:hypothetical protein